MQHISVNNFFAFLSCHYRFTHSFEILNFAFSNIILRRISACKILTFCDQYLQKCKAQKIVKFSFLDFLANLFYILPSKLYGTLKMFPLSVLNNSYLILSSYVEGHVQKNFVSSVGFQVSEIWMFFGESFFIAILEIIFKQKQFLRVSLFFSFLTVFHMVWKKQEI